MREIRSDGNHMYKHLEANVFHRGLKPFRGYRYSPQCHQIVCLDQSPCCKAKYEWAAGRAWNMDVISLVGTCQVLFILTDDKSKKQSKSVRDR